MIKPDIKTEELLPDGVVKSTVEKPSGQRIEFYTKKGIYHGIYRLFDPSGNIVIEHQFRNGIKE